jgi:hypothetical protein
LVMSMVSVPIGSVDSLILDVVLSVRRIYGMVGRLREDASLLTGLDPDTRTAPHYTRIEPLKIDAYQRLGEYLRGELASWDPSRMADAIALSISRVFTVIIFDSTLTLMGCVADEEGGTIKRAEGDLLPEALRLSLGAGKGSDASAATWLNAAQQNIHFSLQPLTDFVIRWLGVGGWRDAEKYKKGLEKLAQLIARALAGDRWVRETSVIDKAEAAKWHYKQRYYIQGMPAEYVELVWPPMTDRYAPHAFCLYLLSREAVKKVELEGGGSAWCVTVDPPSLTHSAKKLGKILEQSSYPRAFFASYYDFVTDVLSNRAKGVTSPIESIEALWSKWVGSLYPRLAKTSKEGDALHLLMRHPQGGLSFSFLNMRLVVSSLAMHRQIAHTYTHVARLLADESDDAAEKTYATKKMGVYKDMSKTLRILCVPKGWEKYSTSLDTIPERPAPSVYELLFYAPTVGLGMVYGALSRVSLALGLEPEIPPDPMRLLEEQRPDIAGSLSGPHFSESLDLLRRSAGLHIGFLERCYRHIEDTLEIPLLKVLVSP